MTTRRDVLQIGAWAAASAAAPAALATRATAKTILILGGTGFIGPHLENGVEREMADQVTRTLVLHT